MTKQEYSHSRYLIRKVKRQLESANKIRICRECGGGFKGLNYGFSVCSQTCLVNRKKKQREAHAVRWSDYRRRAAAAHYHTVKHDPKFIEKCREQARARFKKRQADKLESLVKRCKQCGLIFKPINDRFDYCSRECQRSGERARQNARNKTPDAKARRNSFLRNKIATNPEFKLRGLVSKQVWRALKITRSVKSDSTLAFLPYSIPQLKAHLESFFNNKNGFTWENHGKVWQIDHIIPQSMFPFKSLDSKEFRDCWALSNLMPANKHFNHRKGNRFIGTEDASGQLVFAAPQVL